MTSPDIAAYWATRRPHDWDEPDENGERGHSLYCWCHDPDIDPEADPSPTTQRDSAAPLSADNAHSRPSGGTP